MEMASVLEDALQNLGASAHCPRGRASLPRRSNYRKNEQSDVFACLVADVSPLAGTVIMAKQQLCPTRIGSGVRLRPPKFDTNTSCSRPAGWLDCSWAGPPPKAVRKKAAPIARGGFDRSGRDVVPQTGSSSDASAGRPYLKWIFYLPDGFGFRRGRADGRLDDRDPERIG